MRLINKPSQNAVLEFEKKYEKSGKAKRLFLRLFHPAKFEAMVDGLLEQKKAEKNELKMLACALHKSSVPIAIVATSGKALYANPSYEKLAGMKSEELCGKVPITLSSSFPEERLAGLLSKKESWSGKISFNSHTLEISISPIILKEGRVIGFLVVHGDITSLEQAVSQQNTLLSILIHDVRNPLGSIISFSELLLEIKEKLSDEVQKMISIIFSSAKEISHIMEDLEAWRSSVDSSGKIRIGRFSLKESVLHAASFNSGPAEQKGISISYEGCDVDVLGSQPMVSFVLRNLVSNSIKFSHRGGKILISAKRKDGHVQISVSDSGVGVPKARLHSIFEGGRKNSTAGTEGERGSGFGLALSKNLVEKMGGKMWAESEEGKGATFFFTLPAAEALEKEGVEA